MMFTRDGTTWKVDQFGALWFSIEGWDEERRFGKSWMRWAGIDAGLSERGL